MGIKIGLYISPLFYRKPAMRLRKLVVFYTLTSNFTQIVSFMFVCSGA